MAYELDELLGLMDREGSGVVGQWDAWLLTPFWIPEGIIRHPRQALCSMAWRFPRHYYVTSGSHGINEWLSIFAHGDFAVGHRAR